MWQLCAQFTCIFCQRIKNISFRRSLELIAVSIPNFLIPSFKGVLNTISLINCGLVQINSETFTQLYDLQSINISNNRITYLDKDCFAGLDQLTTIDISHNLLTSLPEGIFDKVSRVEYLYLRGNELNSIPDMLFMNLEYLIHLDISDNGLVTINDSAINSLYSNFYQFKSIDLSRNYLKDIPTGLFQLDSMAEIDLSGNMMSFQSIQTFLKKMLNAKTASNVHKFVSFVNGPKLIKLDNNRFTSFDTSTLDRELHGTFQTFFENVKLIFGDFVFSCDCRMYSLFNYIRSYSSEIISEYSSSGQIIINHNINTFSCFRPEAIRGPLIQAHITVFGCEEDFSECPKHCRCWIRTMDQAVKIDCAKQNLTQLPASTPNFTIQLDFSNNDLVELQNVPDYVHLLQVLDLSGNHLQTINGNIFMEQYNMKDLRLHNNELTTLPQTVSNVKREIQIVTSR